MIALRATARLQQKLDHLEELLLDPDWAANVVVFYQLRSLALRCQRKLAKFAEQLKQQREQRQDDEDDDGFPRMQYAAGERTVARALDVSVEIAVGPVVDRATGRAHQQRAEHEREHHVVARPPTGRDEQRPQRGPQQQQRADRAVQPREPSVQPHALARDEHRMRSVRRRHRGRPT